MDVKELLLKQYRWDAGMARHMIGVLTDDLTVDELNWQARPGHHSVWHHVWHMFLSNDYYAADALHLPPVWEEGNWRERLDLSMMARAFDYTGNAKDGAVPRFVIVDVPDSLVDELKAIPLASYLAYVDDLSAKTTARLEAATVKQLTERTPWYGRHRPAYDRVVSFGHVYRHIGMIEDLRGLIRGPGPEPLRSDAAGSGESSSRFSSPLVGSSGCPLKRVSWRRPAA